MFIPQSVIDSIPSIPADNSLIYSAEDLWGRLTDVYNKKCSYISYDIATLANCIELYSKGFIKGNNIYAPNQLIEESHSLSRLVDCIESVMNLQSDRSHQALYERRQFLRELTDAYFSVRYDFQQFSFDEFKKIYEWASQQRELIMQTLTHAHNKESVFLKANRDRIE